MDSADPHKFLQQQSAVVKARNGSVLARNFILKSDHYASGRALDLDFNLMGAPNFRPASSNLKVYATAQPKLNGLRTILSILSCFPHASSPQKAVWVSTREEPQLYIGGRPFVLRDAENPYDGIALSDRGSQLEEIETRLKEDVLKEGEKCGGCILVHEETDSGRIVANWVAADEIRTPLELFELVKAEGYQVSYHRIPIAHEQDPESDYLDAYLKLIDSTAMTDTLIFNCGMGFVRSTFASIVALIIRRKQRMAAGEKDPFLTTEREKKKSISISSPHTWRALEEADALQTRSKALLLLMGLLNKNLSFKSETELIEVLSSHPKVLEDLIHAIQGRYDIVLQLIACLETGTASKNLIDQLVDEAGTVINLRHTILNQRLRYASNSASAKEKPELYRRGLKALERYFFLIAFASFIDQTQDFSEVNFGRWVKSRDEIYNMIRRMRNATDLRMYSPAQDLSVVSRAEVGRLGSSTAQRFAKALSEGTELVGHEWATSLVASRKGITLRSGLILKRDIWPQEIQSNRKEEEGQERIRGAINFRRITDTNLFALSQPSEAGIAGVLERVTQEMSGAVWLNLREEPLCYVNNHCYVLREESMSLRNLKNFAGISSDRLELIEERLKTDICKELKAFDGRLLLHVEQDDGAILPVWEHATSSDIKTLKELMDQHMKSDSLQFVRIPTTAERRPDFADTMELIDLVRITEAKDDKQAMIVNCQLGSGRSTMALLIILLTQNWLRSASKPTILKRGHERPYSFQIINNLLRVTKNGQEIKSTVDYYIDKCGDQMDLTNSILQYRAKAEHAPAAEQNELLQKGLLNLRRYWWLLLLMIYFQDTDPTSDLTIQQYVESRPVLKTLEQEFTTASLHALMPLGGSHSTTVQSDAMQRVISQRTGRILTAQTILKSDFFSGLQKKTLPEQIDGAPNFRRVNISKSPDVVVFGVGMPTVQGLRSALRAMQPSIDSKIHITWTSMREEPVLYVGGRPHVLRLCDEPFENIVTTGVQAKTVEKMEDQLKQDVLAELSSNAGQVLLHDEVEKNGSFQVTGEWVTVSAEEVLTAAEVFRQLQKEGFHVDYLRIPVTDEQAPLPGVFATLEERVLSAVGNHKNGQLGLTFNCQMGRGRTTTAQIAAALVVQILASKEDPTASAELQPVGLSSPTEVKSRRMSRGSWDDSDMESLFLDGEYKAILQLVGVLKHGKQAKRMADQAIDSMEAVQNLRKAIYDYKLRSSAANEGSEKERKLRSVGQNYLYRYGLLIAFANYLIERIEHKKPDSSSHSQFPEWLRSHREIGQVLSRKGLD